MWPGALGILLAPLLVVAAACKDPARTGRDAAADDSSSDAFEEPRHDAADLDAPTVDGPPDAYVAYPPECTSGTATYLDVSPRKIGDLALSGNVLYISAYEQANTGDISNSVILSIDLTTGDEAYAPVTTAGDAALVSIGDDVYVSITVGGTIMRLHPGVAPETLITGRPSAGAITADSTHVYWSERPTSADPEKIKRRLLTGGAVQDVVTCDQATSLFVVGTNLYCVPFSGSVLRMAKDGSGQVEGLGSNGYLIAATILDGTELFHVGFSVYPRLQRTPLPSGPIGILYEGTSTGRFMGMTATSTHFYVSHMDQGIRRFRRTDLAHTLIATDYVRLGDPVIWNNRLYYATSSYTDAAERWLKYCVD